MAHFNKVVIQGRLGKNPESRGDEGGDIKSCKFSLAVNEYAGVDRNDVTDWFNVAAYDKQAKYICDFANQGDEITFCGRLRADKYQNSVGEEQVYNYIKVEQIINIRKKKEESKQNG